MNWVIQTIQETKAKILGDNAMKASDYGIKNLEVYFEKSVGLDERRDRSK